MTKYYGEEIDPTPNELSYITRCKYHCDTRQAEGICSFDKFTCNGCKYYDAITTFESLPALTKGRIIEKAEALDILEQQANTIEKDKKRQSIACIIFSVLVLLAFIFLFLFLFALKPHDIIQDEYVTFSNNIDVDNSGAIDCIDYTVMYYLSYVSEHDPNDIDIVVNKNPLTGMNHCFIKVKDKLIEPQAPELSLEEAWGSVYNPKFNRYNKIDYIFSLVDPYYRRLCYEFTGVYRGR